MGLSLIPVIAFSVFWAFVGLFLPIVIPKGPNKTVIQVVLMLVGATGWLFWICAYMAQMNPLIGPKLSQHAIFMMAREWTGYDPK